MSSNELSVLHSLSEWMLFGVHLHVMEEWWKKMGEWSEIKIVRSISNTYIENICMKNLYFSIVYRYFFVWCCCCYCCCYVTIVACILPCASCCSLHCTVYESIDYYPVETKIENAFLWTFAIVTVAWHFFTSLYALGIFRYSCANVWLNANSFVCKFMCMWIYKEFDCQNGT